AGLWSEATRETFQGTERFLPSGKESAAAVVPLATASTVGTRPRREDSACAGLWSEATQAESTAGTEHFLPSEGRSAVAAPAAAKV
ncbi:unnamed protein product, partial [Phaeothamnion confervicola]